MFNLLFILEKEWYASNMWNYSDNKNPHLLRRTFLKRFGFGPLWWFFFSSFLIPLQGVRERLRLRGSNHRIYGANASQKKERISSTFNGEVLEYDISFLWFKKAAKGKIAFHKKKEGGYLASIEAETLGFVGWLTQYRKDSYFSHLEEVEGGTLLVSNLFEYEVTIGKKTRKSFVRFDYENHSVAWESRGGGKPDSIKKEDIMPGVRYDDPLVAFYNFRFAVYGPLEEGKEFHIRTVPKKGVSTIYVKINTEKEKKKKLRPIPEGVEYLVDTKIEKELFGSKSGNIEILFSKDFIPLVGIVKDIILFGDIRGELTRRTLRNNS
jgi:hypothetical protein